MQVKEIKLSEIATSPLNPRKTFDEEQLNDLAKSISENGLIQAITLRKKKGENGEKYEIVCGECRYRAHLILKKETIEAVVKELDDKQAFACMVIENLQRKDIDPMEEAAALKHLYAKGEVPVKEISKMLGKSVSFVVNRIQLCNTIAEFVTLMRQGTLNLMHLQEICKLTYDQQKVLWERCFQPANIERWDFKTLKIEMLREWIDEQVMGTLSSARFSLTDETFKTCKACKGCKYNTATYPSRFKEADNPRCMKVEQFRAKNQEAVLRQAKEIGLTPVYVGDLDENKAIIQAAQEMLLYPQPLGKREYLIKPTAPSEDSFTDTERYNKRYANYERVKAIFDENVAKGLVIKVYEISYKGILTGEIKYLYNLQVDDHGLTNTEEEMQMYQLSQLKMQLRASDDHKQEERIERQRAFMESTSYAEIQSDWSATEDDIFLALLTSRLPVEFRKSLGLDDDSVENVTASFNILRSQRNAIRREFTKMVLSDKSVSYSTSFASLLDLALQTNYGNDVVEIDKQLTTDYEKKCKEYEVRIADLESKLSHQEKQPETTEA